MQLKKYQINEKYIKKKKMGFFKMPIKYRVTGL